MTNVLVSAISPSPATLIASAYNEPDYQDAYLITEPRSACVEDFATAFFVGQPGWLSRVSMNLRGHESRQKAIADARYPAGTDVGSWHVYGRSDDEIMFGEHMGFMEYRFSLFLRDDGTIEAGTSVHYLKRFAPFYFTVVKPFHRGFIRVALKNAARAAGSKERAA